MRKISVLIVLIGFLIQGNTLSAQPNIEWQKTLAGADIDAANAIVLW
jgi:hypothetical protein